jgi:hypothetical protein
MKLNLFLSLGLIVCLSFNSSSQDDPFKKNNYGVATIEDVKTSMVKEGLLTDPELEEASFKYIIKGNDNNYPVEVTFNPDGYSTAEIRQIKLNLNTDEIINHNGKKFTIRARMARSIKEVKGILKIYYQYYGEPDTIITPELSDDLKSLYAAMGRSTKSQERTHIWNEKNYIVSFFIPKPRRIDINASELYYNNAQIKYSSLDYEENLAKIQEMIRQELTPSDIVKIYLNNPNWIPSVHPNATNGVYDFHYDIGMATKVSPEEKRAIKAVKFDIVFIDSFQDEVSRWKGINFQLPQPLDRYGYTYNNKGYSITYDSSEKKTLPLEIGRQMNRSSGITIKAKVTAILYTNGDLLKD